MAEQTRRATTVVQTGTNWHNVADACDTNVDSSYAYRNAKGNSACHVNGFNFNIPSNATISKITVGVKYYGSNSNTYLYVYLRSIASEKYIAVVEYLNKQSQTTAKYGRFDITAADLQSYVNNNNIYNKNIINLINGGLHLRWVGSSYSSSYSSEVRIYDTFITVYYTVPCTVTYDGNGANSGSVSAQSGYVGENLTLASNSFINRACVSLYSNDIDGCEYNDDEDRIDPPLLSEARFLGWYTAAEGGTKVGDGGASYTPSGNVTLYAHWSGYPAVTLPSLTREGYAFLGWYDDREGGTKVGDGGESYTPTGDITLYAHWINNAIKLIYLGNKAASFYLGQKPVSKIFKGNTEIYYDPFAE